MKITTICATVMSATVCALTSSTLAGGGAIAWGYNGSGQTNVPNTANSNVTAITGGSLHTLAIKNSGVLAWGSNDYGQTSVPNTVSSGVTNIAAGMYHSLALKGGSLVAWGYNGYGQCTFPTSTGNSTISAIAAGSFHSLAVKNGGVLAFGWNGYSQCNLAGTGTGSGVTSVAGGYGHSAALKAGVVLAWGDNTYGQRTIPTAATGITAIACGANNTIALNSSGNVIAWGYNYYGQCLGTNSAGAPITTSATGTAVKINGVTLSGVTAIAGGSNHTVALKNGVVFAWGKNNYGQCSIPTSATSGVTAIGAGEDHTVAVGVAIIDPCDVDGNGTPNANEPGAATSTWLFPNITSTFENPTNWSAGIPGYDTTAKITGNPQITFGCDNSVKTLELSTNSTDSSPGMSFNLNGHNLTVYGGRIAFAPGAGSYVPYSVNINGGFIYTSPTGGFPLRFESDHATWNINGTQLYSPSIELATIASSQIDVKLSNSILNTAAITRGDLTDGSRHIELLNSSVHDFQGGLTFGNGISLSLGSMMVGDNDYAQNSITAYGGAVFQPGSFLDAWGNLSFVGSASFGGQIDLHAFSSAYHGQSKITVQGPSFNYGAGSSASAFAVMNVYGNNFNQPTCPPPQCADEGLITLQLNYNGLASIGGPLFIHNTDGTIPAEGNIYTLISLDPTYSGAFDPNNNKFSSVRWVGQNGEGLPNGLTFEQVLTRDKLQLHCVRAPIVEPAPSTTTNLANVPFASASADFTSDGRDDVVNLIVGSSNSVQIMKDMGDGTFAQLRTFVLPSGATPNAIAAGNVVGDNAPEIAVTSILNGAGFVTLYSATGGVLWTRQLAIGELPTCVCMLEPSATRGGPGQVSVGTEKTSALNPENAFAGSSGSLKNIGGTNATTSDIPLSGVPRTVRGTDVNGDDFGDTTVVGTTATSALADSTLGFIQQVTMTTRGPEAGTPRLLSYIPVSLAIADIDGDGVKDIFAACNSIPSTIPDSTRPVACFLRGSVSPTNGLYSMSAPTGISVGRPVQGKAVAVVQRNGGFSLAVASNDGVNDSVDVLQLNTFANGGITVGAQTQISTGGSVIGLHTLLDQGTQKFATVRNVNSPSALKNARASKIATMRGENEFTSGAVIESTGYVELLYGDINKDGMINSADLGTLLGQYGLPGIADLNSDGTTNSADLGILLGLL